MGLPGVEGPGIAAVGIIEDLELAHALVGGVASAARKSDRQAVVAPGRQLELDPRREVGVLLVEVDRAPLVRLAFEDAALDLVILDRPGPVSEVLTVEDGPEARVAVLGQDLIGLVRGDLADRDVAPVDLVVVSLELDRAARDQGQLAVPVVLPSRVVNEQLVVEIDRRPLADLDDPEAIPLADRLVGPGQGVLPRRAGAVVPQPAGALVGSHASISGFGEVPDLDLRIPAEVDAAIALGSDLEIDF